MATHLYLQPIRAGSWIFVLVCELFANYVEAPCTQSDIRMCKIRGNEFCTIAGIDSENDPNSKQQIMKAKFITDFS